MLNSSFERKREDYYAKMLKLLIYVKGYSKEQIEALMNVNPFDSNFVSFENDMLNRIKNVGRTIKHVYNKVLYDDNYDIVEFGIDPKLSIARQISGNSDKNITFCECLIDEDASKVMFRKKLDNKVILFYGLYDGMETLLKRLIVNGNMFIVGICVRPNEAKLRSDTISLYQRIGCEFTIEPVIINGKNVGEVFVASNVNVRKMVKDGYRYGHR